MLTVDGYRRIALGLDGVIEKSHMGHPDFRVNGRIFATIQTDERGALMLRPDQQRMFIRDHPDMFVPESGAWGLQGSTRVIFAAADEDVVGEAMTLAWQNRVQAAPPKKKPTTNTATVAKKPTTKKPVRKATAKKIARVSKRR
jgi:hypothetical protein